MASCAGAVDAGAVSGWDGIGATRSGGGPIKWRNETGASQDMTEFRIGRPIQWHPSAIVQAFRFLKAETDLVAKVGLPSPCVVHYFLRRAESSIRRCTGIRVLLARSHPCISA
jgi:hypothetical protein